MDSERKLVEEVPPISSAAWREHLTLVDFHLCNSLPPVHRHEPGVILSPAAQIQDQLGFIATKSRQYRLEPLEGEFAGGEEE